MWRAARADAGFPLIEVLLIIGILAALALPAFMGQREKAEDTAAKSDARNLVTLVEACHVSTERYALCESGDPGLDTVASAGPWPMGRRWAS